MASKEELENLKEIEKIKDLILKLNAKDQQYYTNILNSLGASVNSLNDFKKLTQQIGDDLDEVRNDLDYIYKSFKDSVNELSKQDVYLNLQKSSLNKLGNIARDTLDIRRGETLFEEKKFKKLQDQARINLENLELVRTHGNLQGKAQKALEDQIKTAKELFKAFNEVSKVNKDTIDKLGLTPQILGGIGKTLSKLGLPDLGFEDALNKTKMLGQEAASLGKSFNPLATYTKLVAQNISDQFTKANLLQFTLLQIVNTFKALDTGIGEFAKGMNISYQDAAKLNNEFNNIANSSMDVAVTTKGIRETMLAMGQAMGTNATLNAKDAVTMTKLREQAGFTNDELAKMQELTLATGGNLEDNTKNLLGAASITAMNNGVLLNEKEIMRDVAKASDATKLSLGGSTEALGKAAAQSKALGMSLEQVNNIADSLLQIESSISNELEAELLTGKNLNLEQARLYALNNDMEGLSKEIAKNYGTAAEFSKMNRLQQEAAAKAVGMTREELAGTLVRAEALKSMSGEQAEKAKQAFDTRVKEVGLEQAQKELKEGQLQKMMEQQSIQERFNQSIEKLKEVFVSLLAPLMPVLDIFAMILKPIGAIAGVIGQIVKFTIDWGKYLLIAIGAYKTLQFFGDIEYRRTILTNAAKKVGLITDKQAAVQAKITDMLGKDYISNETKKNLIKEKGLFTTISENIQKRLGLTLDKESLLGKIKSSAIAAKDFVLEKSSLAFKYTRNILEAGYNAIKKIGSAIAKSELMLNIGKAAMGAISSLSSIPIVGWALGLAAAGTIAALGYKYMKGDDMVSPGYGKRTLMGPEGAIALNNKDTVIAGTNLFDKKGDDVVSEPEKITEFKSEGAISATSGGIQIDYNALASAVVSALKNAPMTVNSTLMLDKDVLAKQTVQAVSDNATKVGTAAAVGTSKI
jgi:hypothetical protein